MNPNDTLSISRLSVKNYRKFASYVVTFDSRVTLLTGDNASGKTTLLDAACVCLGAFLTKLEHTKGVNIATSDVLTVFTKQGLNYDKQLLFPSTVSAHGFVLGNKAEWSRSLKSAKSVTTRIDAAPMIEASEKAQAMISGGDASFILPVLVRYSTDRLWIPTAKTNFSNSDFTSSRTMGYENCLHSSANEAKMTQWFKKMTLWEWQNKRPNPAFSAVKNAVSKVFSEIAGFPGAELDYDLETEGLAVSYSDSNGHYHREPLGSLSDGYRCTLSLIADIARRMATLNPALGEHALDAPGIVMIDEVDLHLHPRWQAQIISDLLSAFPNIQLIATTHSPTVVASVKKQHIRILSADGAKAPIVETYGHDSNSILEAIMGSDSRPKPIRELFTRFSDQLEAEKYDEAEDTLNQLEMEISSDDPGLAAARAVLSLERE